VPERNKTFVWPWDRYTHDYLDHYLVSGVEDPRINFQSILTRAFIIDTLFPNAFGDLIDLEWRFGLCCTWIVKAIEAGVTRKTLLLALDGHDTNTCPQFVLDTHQCLQEPGCPLPDFITDVLMSGSYPYGALLPENVLDNFMYIWRRTLADLSAERIRVIEAACGSANDYRFLEECGLARFLDYVGFDMSYKNIENARRRFPDVSFLVADAAAIPFANGSFDLFFVHDLFEHLPPRLRAKALRETIRVTRRQAFLSFFRLTGPGGAPAETAMAVDVRQVVRAIRPLVKEIERIDVSQLVQRKFGYHDYHNPSAKTLIVTV